MARLTKSQLAARVLKQARTIANIASEGRSISWSIIQNKPTIPTDISQLTDNQGLLGSGAGGGLTQSQILARSLGC